MNSGWRCQGKTLAGQCRISRKMYGNFAAPGIGWRNVCADRLCPVSAMQGVSEGSQCIYQGRGRLCSLKGYEPCHNEEEGDRKGRAMILKRPGKPHRFCILCPWRWFCGKLGSGGRIYAPGKRVEAVQRRGWPLRMIRAQDTSPLHVRRGRKMDQPGGDR